ncbi:MAG: M48 family metallopeptidase, partial [Patescibacteria group bacterium]
MTIYSQIDANKQKSWIIMVLFVVFVAGIAWVFGQATGVGGSWVGIALILSGLMSLGSYYYSDRMVLTMSGAQEIFEKDDNILFDVVTNLSIAAGIPRPKIYVINDPAPNAFATGRDPQHAVVCVTTGLRQLMDKAELEGVIAHELSHIGNFDTRLMAIVSILVGVIAMMADWFMRSLWWRDRDDNNSKSGTIFMLLGIVLAILSPVIAMLIQLSISRRREFLADANAAYITRYPEGLARALEKLSAYKRRPNFANSATAHLFIVNPPGISRL